MGHSPLGIVSFGHSCASSAQVLEQAGPDGGAGAEVGEGGIGVAVGAGAAVGVGGSRVADGGEVGILVGLLVGWTVGVILIVGVGELLIEVVGEIPVGEVELGDGVFVGD